ncbi:alpha-1-antichymotrypsin-like [Rhynchocyon petersi]
MSPLLILALLVAGLCPVVLCHSDGGLSQGNEAHDSKTLSLASSNADFAFSLYKQLALQMPNKNIIFSPMSIATALAFVALGARDTTLTEVLNGLKFNLTETSEAEIQQGFQHLLRTLNQSNDELQLSMGNAMFVEESLKLLDKFQKDAQELYMADTFLANFQKAASATKLINDYVEKKTQGKIVDFISDLDSSTIMVLVNYILFKAKWQSPFDPLNTHFAKFHVNKTESVDVAMMKMDALFTPYFRDEKLSCTIVELKYTGNASALFILPDEGKMEEVEAMLSPETLTRWTKSLRNSMIDELYLPTFSISSNYDMKEVLSQLGIKEIFTNEADLSGITGAKNILVSKAYHKAKMDVAEKGTEAAAATGMAFSFTSQELQRMEGPQWQLLVIVLMATAHCLALVDQEGSVSVTADPRDSHSRPGLPCHKISVSNIDFAFSLYRQLAVDNPSENIIFSPASISLALAMLSDGTPAAARTQLLEGLGFNLTVVPETEIQEGFQDLLLRLQSQSPQLLLTTGQHRFRGLHPMAMQDLQEAKKHIEAHVGQQTQGKIGTWMKALGKETTEVLANHILLKASWAQPFDPSTTSLKAFFVDELKAVQVPMMKQKARLRLFHDPELQCTVLPTLPPSSSSPRRAHCSSWKTPCSLRCSSDGTVCSRQGCSLQDPGG